MCWLSDLWKVSLVTETEDQSSEHNNGHCFGDLRTMIRTISSQEKKTLVKALSPPCKQPLEYYYRQIKTEGQGKGKLFSSILEIHSVFHREKTITRPNRSIESVEEGTKRICHVITLRCVAVK